MLKLTQSTLKINVNCANFNIKTWSQMQIKGDISTNVTLKF